MSYLRCRLPSLTERESVAPPGSNRNATLTRRNIQLAPDEVDQPNRPTALATATPASATPASESRTWTDASGQHKIEAIFLGASDGKVNLRRTDGKEIAIPLDKLSVTEQQLVQQLLAAPPPVENPFE